MRSRRSSKLALRRLNERAGAEIVDPATVDRRRCGARKARGTCRGFKYDINDYLATRGERAPVHSLDEIIASRQVSSVHPAAAAARAGRARRRRARTATACKAEADYREAFGAAITKTMDEQKLDAFVYPTWSFPPRLIGDLSTPHGDNSQVFSPTSGFPAITVPMGYTRDDTLPAGLTFLGRAWSEATLIKLAYAYEQATHHRRPPASTPALK